MYDVCWWGCGVKYRMRPDGTMVEDGAAPRGLLSLEQADRLWRGNIHTAIYTADGRLVHRVLDHGQRVVRQSEFATALGFVVG